MSRRVDLDVGQVLERRDEPVSEVYFPLSGVASIVARGDRSKDLETGPMGWEGMTGLPVILGVDKSPTETIVQVRGSALVAPAAEISRIIETSTPARRVFLAYAYAFGLQVVHTALAASLASVDRRLARWLLMLHDRVDGDSFDVTHDFIAMMLGVRRPGVTVALHVLEGHRFIKSTRGKVTIVDRQGLETFSGVLYGRPESEYRRVIGERAGGVATGTPDRSANAE